MFADAIKLTIHPATWAVMGIQKDAMGNRIAPRGTAFAVNKKGLLLTCWHVTYMDKECTQECDEFLVTQPGLGPARFRAVLVSKDRDTDLALLRIDGEVATKAVVLVDDTVPYGRSCCAFGHPLSIADAATQSLRIFTRAAGGIVSMPHNGARFDNTKPVRLYELDLFAHGGASGGPVFLKNGDVFAIVSGAHLLDDGTGKQARSNLSLCIDIREAIQFLDALGIDLQTRRRVK